MKNDPTYHQGSRSLLQKWLTGEATRHDERALDAAAKEDPFLAEATDGYRYLPEADHAADLTRLKARLRQKTQRRRGLGFYALRIAAVGLVLVGAWLAMQQFQYEKSATMAETTTATDASAPNASSAAPVPSADTTPALTTDAGENAQAKTFRKNTTQQQNATLDKNNDAVAYNRLDDAPAEKPAAAPPPVTVTATEANESVAIQEEPAKRADNDDAGTLRKASPSKKEAAKMKVASLSPIGGLENFKKYVTDNLRHPEADKQPRPQQSVLVTFTISADGTPTDFEIPGNVPQAYKDEAIRLLKQGPKWLGIPGEKGSYAFSFR